MNLNSRVPFPKAHRPTFFCGRCTVVFYAWQIDLWALGTRGWETVFLTRKVQMPITWTHDVNHFVQISTLSRLELRVYFWILGICEIWHLSKRLSLMFFQFLANYAALLKSWIVSNIWNGICKRWFWILSQAFTNLESFTWWIFMPSVRSRWASNLSESCILRCPKRAADHFYPTCLLDF